MLISHAQNFEDVILMRALKSVAKGFYIDIGAAEPDVDSVTKTFFDMGWTGINVEPVPGSFSRLSKARPTDINVQAAIAASAGRRKLFLIDESTGLATIDPVIAQRHIENGRHVRETVVDACTLEDLCRRHVGGDVHFLKIDVEGAEKEVLEGANFKLFRPWIVLVEATTPGSSVASHESWEPILRNANYSFVYFDGLNRFYVANEHENLLKARLSLPPNIFDEFITAREHALMLKVNQLQDSWKYEFDRANGALDRESKLQIECDAFQQEMFESDRYCSVLLIENNKLRTEVERRRIRRKRWRRKLKSLFRFTAKK